MKALGVNDREEGIDGVNDDLGNVMENREGLDEVIISYSCYYYYCYEFVLLVGWLDVGCCWCVTVCWLSLLFRR